MRACSGSDPRDRAAHASRARRQRPRGASRPRPRDHRRHDAAPAAAAPGWPGVCHVCRNLIGPTETTCRWCRRHPQLLDALAIISYSAGGHFLHRSLRAYKDGPPQVRERETARLAALLWRFLGTHEPCVARAAGVERFDVVTTVPSRGQLDRLVRDFCWPTLPRYRPLLAGSGRPFKPSSYEPSRFVARKDAGGASVLLIDDTWTTGSTVQSAAAALRAAGAATIAAVVLGRHVNVEYLDIGHRLASRRPLFDWPRCATSARISPARTTGSQGTR